LFSSGTTLINRQRSGNKLSWYWFAWLVMSSTNQARDIPSAVQDAHDLYITSARLTAKQMAAEG
jgi:hypothetical protein